jgi:hypothetical protein
MQTERSDATLLSVMTDGEVRKAVKVDDQCFDVCAGFESIRFKSCFHIHITANLIKSNLNKAPCSLAQQLLFAFTYISLLI